MKKYFTLTFLFISFSLFSQVVENPGFEEWQTAAEVDGPNMEPTNWSSIQTGTPDNLANFAPQVMFQSTDAHSGDYSVRLKNVFVAVANTIANGVLTNGQLLLNFNPELANSHTEVGDTNFYTYCTNRPDSLVGYYKYTPVGEDITVVQALLHIGSIGTIPDADSTGWIGSAVFNSPNETVSEWTRFSAPFQYFDTGNPEYVLFNLSSGNAYEAVAGSEGWYDDIELIYNPVGINEVVANQLLNIYSTEKQLTVDLNKFSQGETFKLQIYSVSGQLIVNDQVTSGNQKSFYINESGIYICKLEDKYGFVMTKKVVVK